MSAKKDLATQVREYTDKLHRDYAELKQERAALEERKAFLFAAPLDEHDFYQMVEDYIDAQASNFINNSGILGHKRRFAYPHVDAHPLKREPISLAIAERVRTGDEYTLAGVSDTGNVVFGSFGPAQFHMAMCFFFGDTIKEKLIELLKKTGPHLDEDDARQIGPTIAERRAEIATIDARIAEIGKGLAEIKAELETFVPPLTPEEQAEERRKQAEATRARNTLIRDEFNGRNQTELVKRYRLPQSEIEAIIASDPRRAASR